MDINMPGIDGFQSLSRIRKLGGENAKVPIIALTADAMTDQVAHYTSAGFTGYFAKPIDVENLVDSVGLWASEYAELEGTSPQEGDPGSQFETAAAK